MKKRKSRERDNEAEAKVEAAFITEYGRVGQSNGHLVPLFYRSVSFYYRGEIAGQIKANFANFRPRRIAGALN